MDILKKQLGVILANVILVVILVSAECAAENKTLVFVGNDSYPPISYQEGGKPKGLAIDIVRELGQRMGRQIDIRLMEWKVAQEMVAQGKADALCQLSITEARKQIYDFSDQAHDLRFSIFVRTRKQGIDDLSDLRGLQVAVIAGSVQYNIAMADPQIKFTLTTNDIQSFQLLKDRKVDAVLADLWTGSYVLAENGITGIQTSGEPFAHLVSAIAVKKGNTTLLAAINDGLRSLQADGTIERINVKWRPKEIIVQTREQAMRKTYSVLIGILVMLLVVGALWLITLKREISERRRVEEALRESDQRYQSLFEQASDGIFILDNMGKISSVNKSFASMHGYTVEEIRSLGLDHLDVEGSAPVAERIRRIMNGETLHFEVEHYHKDGHTFPLGVTANLVKFGNELLIIAIHRDLTELKRAEEAVRTDRNLIANIMETSPMGITTVDSTGKITFANSKAIAIMGLSKDEVSQIAYNAPTWCISDLNGNPFPDDRLPFTLVMSTGKAVFDVQHAIQWPDGKRILLSINGAPMIDANGQLNGMVASIEDITERKQTEENYRTLFREMIDSFALHEIICDEEGLPIDYRFLAVNPAFERMTGRKAGELVGKTVLDVLPKTERYWIETYGKVALTGEPVFFENYAVELGKHFEVTSFQSAPKQFACIFADITDRKQAEEERAKLESQLQQAQKMEAIGTLAGGIAHDFNNILAAIIGYTEMAAGEDQKDIQEQYLQETLKGAERAKSLVKQILAFSRQDRSEKKPIEVKLLFKEAIKFLRASIPTTIEIHQHFTDEPCNIMADATQMHQIIMNLCTNATYAMKQTGGVLKIELSTLELVENEIPFYPDLRPGPYIKLAVSDTGHGVDPILHQRIFDPFFTTKSKGEGTGLGLSVVYGIVRSHDGVINVYSEPGKGASFSVYLPRIIHEEVVSGNLSRTVIGGTERILFVDDEEALVELGTRMLSSLGYEVTGCINSMEALDLFRSNPMSFDIVITDMTLPKMTGIDLSREILQIRPDMPIVLCSGIHESETEEQVKSLGIRAYCTKPLTRKELSGVIRDILDGHENIL